MHHYTCYNPSRVYSIDNHLLKCQNSLIDSLMIPCRLNGHIGSYREIAIAIESEAGDSLT